MVKLAVCQNGCAIYYCPKLQTDREIVLLAIQQNKKAIEYSRSPLYFDTSFQFILQDPIHRRFIQDINVKDIIFKFY
jgi:hypothetical protein